MALPEWENALSRKDHLLSLINLEKYNCGEEIICNRESNISNPVRSAGKEGQKKK